MERNSLEELNKVLDYNFKNSLTLAPFHLSCPECFKVFAVNPHEITSTKPKFNCNSCDAHFYINYPEFLEQGLQVGLVVPQSSNSVEKTAELKDQLVAPTEVIAREDSTVVDVKEEIADAYVVENIQAKAKTSQPTISEQELIKCPKCDYVNSILSEECIKCSVVLSKVSGKRAKKIKASEQLEDLWKLALDNYDNDVNHQNFIRYSHLENNLEYASAKYNSILSVNPHDDVANDKKKQIMALSTVSLNKQDKVVKPVKSLFSVFNIWFFSFVLSIIIIGLGVYYTQYKNLIGVGASALCLVACLKYLNDR